MEADSISGFSFAKAATASSPSQIEDEVVALFERLRAPVLRYLLSFRIPVADAEEIVQEVFLGLFQHLQKGKPRENLQGWIFKVAHNAALKQRLRIRQYRDCFSAEPGLTESASDPNAGPEEILSDSQRQKRLLGVVQALPEREQCCLSLRAEGLRYREIAEVLGISLGAVAASLEKSLSRLRRAEQTGGTFNAL